MPRLKIRTIRYAPDCVTEISPGPWRRNAIWIALGLFNIASLVVFFLMIGKAA